MKISAGEIAKIVSGEISGDAQIVISGVNGLAEAQEGEISFLGNPKYVQDALKTKASALLVPQNSDVAQFGEKTLIKVQNPQYAFSALLAIVEKERFAGFENKIHSSASVSETACVGENVYIGQNAVIEDGARVGKGTKIFPNVYIGRNSKIGEDCVIYPNVVIRENVKIGDRAILQPSVVVGGDGFGFATIEGENKKIPQIGTVEIGDDVEIGAHSTIDRATVDATRIGSGTKIDNLVMVAHNVQIGKNCLITAQCGIAGSSKLGNNVVVGAQSGIIGHIKIGNNVMIAGQSGVSGNLSDGERVGGNPMVELNQSIKIRATLRKLPEMYKDLRKLKEGSQKNG